MIKATEIVNYLRAGFPIINIKTDEPERMKTEIEPIIKNCETINFEVIHWDMNTMKSKQPIMEPLEILNQAESNTVVFAYNYHWFIDKPNAIQELKNQYRWWASKGKCFIIVSHIVKIPPELSKDIITMELPLPCETTIEETLDKSIPDNRPELKPKEKDKSKIIKSSRGLTVKELESIYSLSLIEKREICSEVINKYKEQTLAKTGFLTVIQPNADFSSVIGFDKQKNFILDTINDPKAKGTLSIGPPGTGKTSLAKAVVGETGKFGLIVDMGKLFSKYVGDTGKNIDFVIDLITALKDAYVLIDEFEKQFAGAGSDGSTDSGNTKRSLSKWLDFLQNRPSGIYIGGTANSFMGIPPEYLRPGRWDTSPFYMDLPSEETRQTILDHYISKAENKIPKPKSSFAKSLTNFSGAEIEAMVKVADMKKIGLTEAKEYIIPIAETMSEEINQLREWAEKRCIPADTNVQGIIKDQRRLDI